MGIWYIVFACVIVGVVANDNALPINQIYSLEAALTLAESKILERIERLSDKMNAFNDRVDQMKSDISSMQLELSTTKAASRTTISACMDKNFNSVQMKTNEMLNTTQTLLGKLSDQLQHLTASSKQRMINVEHQLERLPPATSVYFMKPDSRFPLNFTVSHDWTNNHGFGDNWIVFQRRSNGSLNFNRNWTEYRDGFGDVRGDHWLGLDKLHAIVQMRQHELLIVLEDFDGVIAYAHYDDFRIGNETEKYVIKSVGRYKGTAGDSFSSHRDEKFSTHDQDNDKHTANCAQWASGGWWFYKCHKSYLNGAYFTGKHIQPAGIMWTHFRGTTSLKSSRMMVRPAE
ncbi:microfibril-associated glycoprotein 4-like [Anopheles stephensi]|uniref:Fibrinogen C-terminal domain-containing protein n=1 Tax=Anopheles stephensi TaxID=30069 RepID=A0A182YBQ6_ANOST|nr:microfibril-associated glycoprotein 4-like [Anopheles stephensi]XP_035893500.1 microfibril-associated glycoprotein 4-like [Anopheles stephensi]